MSEQLSAKNIFQTAPRLRLDGRKPEADAGFLLLLDLLEAVVTCLVVLAAVALCQETVTSRSFSLFALGRFYNSDDIIRIGLFT